MYMRFHRFTAVAQTALMWIILCFPPTVGIVSAEMLIEGATLTQLTTDSKSQAWSWAYRGNRIAYLCLVSDTQAQLRTMNADGTDDRAASPIGNPFFVEWNWGGDKLAYEFSNYRKKDSPAEVRVYDISSGTSKVVSRTYTFGALSTSRQFEGTLPGMSGPRGNGPFWSPDDKKVAYTVRTLGGSEEVWVADANTGWLDRALSTRRFVGRQRWSFELPHRLVVLVDASGGNDVATIDIASSRLTLLTDVGLSRVRNQAPKWSPTSEWIAYISDEEMRDEEQHTGRSDVWIVRPDGSERRNLTRASSKVLHNQLQILDLSWSWDGKWIQALGNRFDLQGRAISSIFLISPRRYRDVVQTSYPETTGELERAFASVWAYDSTKFAFLSTRNRIRDWTSDPEFENTRTVLRIYDLKTKSLHDVLEFTEEIDDRQLTGQFSWSPDGRSILLTIEHITSVVEGITHPDVYRLDLPDFMVAREAAFYRGPPVGAGSPQSPH